jgi:post-segregation antitoxin (ccd killing protein)
MKQAKVPIPANVLEGVEAVRQSGKTNMLDVSRVIELAFEMEHYATVLWLHENRRQYSKGLFQGFEPVDNIGGEGSDESCAD